VYDGQNVEKFFQSTVSKSEWQMKGADALKGAEHVTVRRLFTVPEASMSSSSSVSSHVINMTQQLSAANRASC